MKIKLEYDLFKILLDDKVFIPSYAFVVGMCSYSLVVFYSVNGIICSATILVRNSIDLWP